MVAILAWVFTALLLVLVIACVAAGRGSLARNRFFGVKLPALERSDASWREGHAAAVAPAAVAFVAALVASVVGLFAPIAYVATLVVAAAGVIWVCVRASRAAARQP